MVYHNVTRVLTGKKDNYEGRRLDERVLKHYLEGFVTGYM